MEKKENVMTEELAIADFERLAEAKGVDYDPSLMNEEDAKAFLGLRRKIVKKIMSGAAVVTDESDITFTLSDRNPEAIRGKVLTFTMPNAAAYMGADSYNEKQSMHKFFAMLSAMTGEDIGLFRKIEPIDLKAVMAIGTFFLSD